MESLELDPRQIVFPHRCLACGATPTTSYTLEATAGLDVLLFALRTCVPVEVPLCAPCGRHKTWGRVGWFALILGSLLAPWGAVIGLHAILGDMAVAIFGAVLLPGTIGVLWWARNREDRLYHRWFSPAWIVAFDRTSCLAQLGLREARTRQEVGVLSGVLDASEFAGRPGYREHGGPVPAAFSSSSPPARPIPWWAVLVFGLVTMGTSVLDYAMEGQSAAGLALWLAVGLAFAWFGIVLRRAERATKI
jgi:hypothetical protein